MNLQCRLTDWFCGISHTVLAEVSMNMIPASSVYACASSLWTFRLMLKSVLLPASAMTMFGLPPLHVRTCDARTREKSGETSRCFGQPRHRCALAASVIGEAPGMQRHGGNRTPLQFFYPILCSRERFLHWRKQSEPERANSTRSQDAGTRTSLVMSYTTIAAAAPL
eukprot:SAG11_NODE_369_length_10077_cov_34.025857_3_plen_167_part_00